MNDDENVEKIEQAEQVEQGAVTTEGAVANPETDEVAKMYEELGIKAPVPTDKPKGRPKTSKVRAEKSDEKRAEDSSDGKSGNQDDKDKSKNAPTSDDDGNSGDNPDSKGKKVSKDSTEVSDKPEEADDRVRQTEPRDEGDSKRGSEEDTDQGADRAGQEDDQSQDPKDEGEEDEDTEVKRPGKSNPEIERRFQRLTEEKRERDQRIAELERQLQETSQQYQQAQIAQEDPEYTIDDFRKVRDDEGNIIDLDEDRAELAWRRWKDGYDQRAAERQAEAQRQQTMEQYQQAIEQRLMQKSVEAYDTLTSLADEYPELNENSPKFDQELASEVMPIIRKMVEYQEGTEPGNPQGLQPVITGMKMNPRDILGVINRIRQAKRSLPLNGIDDNVESRSNVNVPHSRSSDPTIRAANDLYKELGINKRM